VLLFALPVLGLTDVFKSLTLKVNVVGVLSIGITVLLTLND
jgi:hypothetical protein